MESEKPYSKKNNYYEKSDFNQKNSGSGKKFSIVSTEKKDQTSDKVGNSKIQPQVHLLTKYSNFDWTKISIDESYSNFKELEKVLKALVEVRYISILKSGKS